MHKRTLILILATLILIVLSYLLIESPQDIRLLALMPKILHYRPLLQKYATRQQLDWRLLCALIIQESGFNEHAISSIGAQGLTQLMPTTAEELGVRNPFDAEQNVEGATRYLRTLYDAFPNSPHEDRLKLALASYNGGIGHLRDAQTLVRHQGADPHTWAIVRATLPRLTKKDVLLHQNVWKAQAKPPHGYFDGFHETIAYVERVIYYYERLRFYREMPFFRLLQHIR